MSNLKIGFADIGWDAEEITPSAAMNSVLPEANLSRGMRGTYGALNIAATTYSMVYNLGTGNSATADSLIIARADILQDAGVTSITVDRSSNGSAWTTEHTVTTPATYTLKGPLSHDIFDTFTESSAWQYWRISMSGSSNVFKHSKHYIGKLFDFGSDPVEFSEQLETNAGKATGSAGNFDTTRLNSPQRRYKIKWRGVTDAKIGEARSSFLQWAIKNSVFLVTTTNDEILNNFEVVHCRIDSRSIEVRQLIEDYNEIEIEFLEDLG